MLITVDHVTCLVTMNNDMKLQNNVPRTTIKWMTLTLILGANMRVAPHLCT